MLRLKPLHKGVKRILILCYVPCIALFAKPLDDAFNEVFGYSSHPGIVVQISFFALLLLSPYLAFLVVRGIALWIARGFSEENKVQSPPPTPDQSGR